jgi:ribosomal protein S18 acetylase RimI-like enzyme
MDLILLTDAQKAEYREQIFRIMLACDRDFVPPLSARFSTSDTVFSAKTGAENGINAYFEDMIGEQMLAAIEDGKLLGFVTFKRDLVQGPLTADTLPNLYICTLLLSPAARGKGLTAKMYAHLFDTLYPDVNLFTRTWSTNAAHLKILARFGFSLIKRIENDRGDGIDTVYFGRERVRGNL